MADMFKKGTKCSITTRFSTVGRETGSSDLARWVKLLPISSVLNNNTQTGFSHPETSADGPGTLEVSQSSSGLQRVTGTLSPTTHPFSSVSLQFHHRSPPDGSHREPKWPFATHCAITWDSLTGQYETPQSSPTSSTPRSVTRPRIFQVMTTRQCSGTTCRRTPSLSTKS
jgi:hypothetical protein